MLYSVSFWHGESLAYRTEVADDDEIEAIVKACRYARREWVGSVPSFDQVTIAPWRRTEVER